MNNKNIKKMQISILYMQSFYAVQTVSLSWLDIIFGALRLVSHFYAVFKIEFRSTSHIHRFRKIYGRKKLMITNKVNKLGYNCLNVRNHVLEACFAPSSVLI